MGMGLTLMDNDLSLIVGEIRGVTKALTERLDRQDAETIRNKQEAIAARDANHEENRAAIRELRETMDGTATITRDNARWIDEQGKPGLADHQERIAALEGRNAKADVKNAFQRGGMKTWAAVWAAVLALGGAIAAYGKDALDFLRGLNHGG